MIANRPICDKLWDDIDATIACRELFGKKTKGIATKGGEFGGMSTNFIISEVKCEISNKKFRYCPYKTRNVCPNGGIAGIVCIDPEQITLVSNNGKNEGNIIVHGKYPVCGINWDRNDAQVVCNSIYRKQFTERPNEQVPVFTSTVNSAFGSVPNYPFVMSNVQCKGDEKWLTDCVARYHPLDKNQCTVHQAAGVQCAKCTIADLKKNY